MAKRYIPEADIIVEEDDNSLPYFLLGLGLGAVIGVLFAPQSGEETRRLLKTKAEEGVGYVKRRTSEFQEVASEAVEQGLQQGKETLDSARQSFRRRKEGLSVAVEAGRNAYREATATAGTPENE